MLLPAVLTLTCAFLFAVAAVLLKAAQQQGADLKAAAPGMCVLLMLFSLLLLPFIRDAPSWPRLPWALLAGLLMLGAIKLQIVALAKGAVSVQTPLMGSKVVMIMLLGAALTRQIPELHILGAAGFSGASILLIGWPDRLQADRKHLWNGMVWALLSTLCAALLDLLIAYQATAFGFAPFLVIMCLPAGVYGVAGLRALRYRASTRQGGLLTCAMGLMALQIAGMSFILGVFQGPTTANVLYGSRVLFGWLLPLLLASRFHLEEETLTAATLARRAAGALLSLGAIALVFL